MNGHGGRVPNGCETSGNLDSARQAVSGLDGLLCPVCGEISHTLPVRVHRVRADAEECYFVCSEECKDAAHASPHLQTNLFGRDARVWRESVQGELGIAGAAGVTGPMGNDQQENDTTRGNADG